MEHLTLAAAVLAYYQDPWQPLLCAQLPPAVAIVLADSAINCGSARAVRWLQELVATKPDGNIGPKTVAAVNSVSSPLFLATSMIERRRRYYTREVRPALFARYGRGWLARLEDLKKFVDV